MLNLLSRPGTGNRGSQKHEDTRTSGIPDVNHRPDMDRRVLTSDEHLDESVCAETAGGDVRGLSWGLKIAGGRRTVKSTSG